MFQGNKFDALFKLQIDLVCSIMFTNFYNCQFNFTAEQQAKSFKHIKQKQDALWRFPVRCLATKTAG
jgi:hypothetical protein